MDPSDPSGTLELRAPRPDGHHAHVPARQRHPTQQRQLRRPPGRRPLVQRRSQSQEPERRDRPEHGFVGQRRGAQQQCQEHEHRLRPARGSQPRDADSRPPADLRRREAVLAVSFASAAQVRSCSPSASAIPIPLNCNLVGKTICTQGVSTDGLEVQLSQRPRYHLRDLLTRWRAEEESTRVAPER